MHWASDAYHALTGRRFAWTLLAALSFSAFAIWLVVAILVPQYHYRAARQALEQFQAESASAHMAACLRAWPQSGEIHLLAARAERLANHVEGTEAELEACRLLNVPLHDITRERAMLRAQNGDLDSVEKFLRNDVELGHPDTIFILEAMVRGAIRVYRLNLAKHCLKLWLERQPDSVQAFLLRARMWELVHNYQDAVSDYQHVVEIDKNNTEARLGMANCLLELAQPSEALVYLEGLARQHADDPQILVRLACCLNSLNRAAEAQTILDGVLANHPDMTPALQGRAQVALQQGDPEEAERFARQSMALDPYDYQVNYLYYQCLKQNGKFKEAEAQFVQMEKLKNGILRMQELANHKLQAAPNDPALLCEMGTLCIEMGQGEVGLGWLLSALQKAPNFKPAHVALAHYYEQIGDGQRAAIHRRLAANVPGNADSPATRPKG
jgi:tetratricopeptide (TPR) repeat protein